MRRSRGGDEKTSEEIFVLLKFGPAFKSNLHFFEGTVFDIEILGNYDFIFLMFGLPHPDSNYRHYLSVLLQVSIIDISGSPQRDATVVLKIRTKTLQLCIFKLMQHCKQSVGWRSVRPSQ